MKDYKIYFGFYSTRQKNTRHPKFSGKFIIKDKLQRKNNIMSLRRCYPEDKLFYTTELEELIE